MLLDTSGLLCLHHAGEPQHAAAVTLFDAATDRLTHSYVLAEFVALNSLTEALTTDHHFEQAGSVQLLAA